MGELLGLSLIGGFLGFTLWPLFKGGGFCTAVQNLEGRRKILEDQRDTIYSNLKDLEMEFRMGRLSEKDYGELRGDHLREAAKILRELDSLEAAHDLGERLASAQADRAMVTPALCCSHCAKALRGEDRFCPQCGEPVAGSE